jgi:hypothetical protein
MNTPDTEPVIVQPTIDHPTRPQKHHSQEHQSDQDELVECQPAETIEGNITRPSRLDQVPVLHLPSQPGTLALYTPQGYGDSPLVIPPVDRSFAVDQYDRI